MHLIYVSYEYGVNRFLQIIIVYDAELTQALPLSPLHICFINKSESDVLFNLAAMVVET